MADIFQGMNRRVGHREKDMYPWCGRG